MRKSIGLFSFVLFIGFVVFAFFGNPLKYYTLKKEFETYLEAKYNQPFRVEKVTFDPMHRTYHSNATPANNPQLRFYIGQNNITKEIDDAYELEKDRLKERLDQQ